MLWAYFDEKDLRRRLDPKLLPSLLWRRIKLRCRRCLPRICSDILVRAINSRTAHFTVLDDPRFCAIMPIADVAAAILRDDLLGRHGV